MQSLRAREEAAGMLLNPTPFFYLDQFFGDRNVRFVDEAKITVTSGAGGRGCVSFRREKHVPRGGPNGGDGGAGGGVTFQALEGMTSLLDFRYKRHYKAKRGTHGMGKDCHGKNGEELILKIPVGTVIKDFDTDETLVDLTEDGESYVCLKGGRGGKGNAHFKSSTNRAPKFAQPGEEGEERTLKLELKLLADVGIIGFPNAGKSTFISRVSAAKPKVADYPFTTTVPNLGLVSYSDFKSFVVADIPGLVKGAHKGKGLGTRFLKHIERTALFLHMLDLSPDTGREPKDDFEVITNELVSFDPALAERPSIVVLNKADIVDKGKVPAKLLNYFEDKGIKVFIISAITGQGIDELVNHIGKEVERLKSGGSEKKNNA